MAGLLLTWLRAFGEYGATVLIRYHPYTLPVFTEVQFSGSGLPHTQAPTALALLAAIAVVGLSQLRRPARWRRSPVLPPPVSPASTEPTSVSFDLDATVGSFRLQCAHHTLSHPPGHPRGVGVGKVLTLRSLAGLLGPDAGRVTYGSDAVSSVAPEDRRVGYVPQGFGLFPHRTLWQQVLFAADADDGLAAWWLDTLQLNGPEERLPHELSGEQRQRVSLARALSRSPRVLLLDEPFSGLDARVRQELRRELRRLQRERGLSTVLVTHDPEEAALLADEVVVIDEGRVLQTGPVQAVYRRPSSPLVARLVGVQNVNEGVAVSPVELKVGTAVIRTAQHGAPDGAAVLWCIRPGAGQPLGSRAIPYPCNVDIADLIRRRPRSGSESPLRWRFEPNDDRIGATRPKGRGIAMKRPGRSL